MRSAAFLLLLLVCCTEQVREARETPRERPFAYRISLEDQELLETPGSAMVLTGVPAGAVVAETGAEDSPWIEDRNGVSWINVAYRGDVGWLKTASTGIPAAMAFAAPAQDFTGTWYDTQICAGRPAFLSINPGGSFSGMRCEYCDIAGCPNGLSGTWKTENNLVCLDERRDVRACFFVWKNRLVALPQRGFFWEYHGGAALSGLAKK
jgi:hypothetical protein